ncbi:MAG: ATP-grasp domain-containing protein [Candidatus Magasanikbacteria bacterium]
MKFSLKKPVIYVARDLERALGLPITTKGYYIISNYTSFANSLVKGRKNVLLVKSGQILDTRELLNHQTAVNFINNIKDAQLLVFKNTPQIEKICLEHDWVLLNPPASLSAKVEEKISQVKWLGGLKKYLPRFSVRITKEIFWEGKPFILQFNRAHTGSGTILVENEKQLSDIQTKFPLREVRVTQFISGPIFTNNNIVWGNKVLVGNINYQITGLKPFTNNRFATVGNDWSLPHEILSAKQKKEYAEMATAIGKKLAQDGWKGLFGIDVVQDEKTGQLYLIEINARQPASTSFESYLQLHCHSDPLRRSFSEASRAEESLTTFQAHLSALQDEKNAGVHLIKITTGAQITQKVVAGLGDKKIATLTRKLITKKFKIFLYDNHEIEKDLLRIQTKKSMYDIISQIQ